MPITRTTMIDDDGSGTTGTILNNAWLQTIYNQIDAADAGIKPTYGSWTPVDASGAGLAFLGGTVGYFAKFDRLVCVWAQVLYPTNTDTLLNLMGGLPFPVRAPGGAWQGYGIGFTISFPTNTSTLMFLHASTGLQLMNGDVSGSNTVLGSVYLTD